MDALVGGSAGVVASVVRGGTFNAAVAQITFPSHLQSHALMLVLQSGD